MDFTQKKYKKLCQAIVNSSYQCLTLENYFIKDNTSSDSKYLILRHDVDRFLGHALALAKIEKEHSLRGTYYFRASALKYPGIIKKVANLGHEIGFHYECLDLSQGDIKKAGELFRQQLASLRDIAPIKTVAMHGNPLTKYDNKDIWSHCKLEDFGLIGEAYLSMDFSKVFYYSDTGRTWQDDKHNLKDRISVNKKNLEDKPRIKRTNDLIEIIKNENSNLYLTVHPERWSSNSFTWLSRYIFDSSINSVKYFVSLIK